MSVRGRLSAAPRGLWACAIVAVLSAWIWSVATPAFQVPDEVLHDGYVQYVGETGKIPRPLVPFGSGFAVSDELGGAVTNVPFSFQGVPSWDRAHSKALLHALDRHPPATRETGAGSAANNPPLYYYVEALPYVAAKSANIFDRLLVMRLFSSLFAGITAALCFLFVRELLPRTPWAWVVGGMAVALQPVHGFIAGGVNPDSLLWAACAGLFLAIARTMRHGLTRRRALAVGVALSVGLLTKAAMYAMVPGALLALAIGAWRLRPSKPREALVAGGLGLAASVVPFAVWLVAKRGIYENAQAVTTTTTGSVAIPHGSVSKLLSYVWQQYLPRLPFQNDLFGGYPLWDVYFQGFVGRFGYFFFDFPIWVDYLALLPAAGVLALAGRALWQRSGMLRPLLPEVGIYLLMGFSLLLLIGVAGYQFTQREGLQFAQTRYLFLLLPLYGALVAVAAKGAGRWGRRVGLGLVALFAAHDLFAVLLTVSHYYS